MSLEVPYGYVGKKSPASASQRQSGKIETFKANQVQEELAAFRLAHKSSDQDFAPTSLHHTLGTGPNQAASGADLTRHYDESYRRIGTTKRETGSASVTGTELVIDTVTVMLAIGHNFEIFWDSQWQTSVADGQIRCRIREDSVTGTTLQLRQAHGVGVVAQAKGLTLFADYEAVAEGEKTFVGTAIRQSGTGTWTSPATAVDPTFLKVYHSHLAMH